MPAKTYAAFPLRRPGRASLALADTKSVVGSIKGARATRFRRTKSVVSSQDVFQLPTPKRSFEEICGKTGEFIHLLFIAEKEKDKIYARLVKAHDIGVKLSKENPALHTYSKSDEFFKAWELFANELSVYYEKPAIERLRAFASSTIATIKGEVNPLVLKDLTDNANWVNDKQFFDTHLRELKTLFQSDYIDEPAIQRTVYDLMNHTELSSNAFFRPVQMDFATQQEIVYQCHYRFSRIIDATYDYNDDEPVVRRVINELNKLTDELRMLFKPGAKKGVKYLNILTRKALSRHGRKSSSGRKISASRSQQLSSAMRLSQVAQMKQSKQSSDEPEEASKSVFITPKMMYLEKIDKLNMEIAELKKRHADMKTDIEEHMARKALSPEVIEQARHRKYITTYHQNGLYDDVIKFLKESVSQLEGDVNSLKSINEELEEGKDTQTVSFSNTKLDSDMKELHATLKKCTDDNEFAEKSRDKSANIDTESSSRDQILLAWRALVFETEGLEDLNHETEACALALQTRIDQLRRATTKRSKPGPITGNNTKQIRELLKKKDREMRDLRKLMDETDGNSLDLTPVEEVDRYWISDDAPAPLLAAQAKLEASRNVHRLVVDRANQVQAELLSAILESETSQIRLLEMKRQLRLQGIEVDIPDADRERYEQHTRERIDSRAALSDLLAMSEILYHGFDTHIDTPALSALADVMKACNI